VLLALLVLGAIWNGWQRYQWQQWSQVNPIFHADSGKPQHYGTRLGNEDKPLRQQPDTWILKPKNSVPSVKMIKSWVVYYFITARTLGSIFDDSEPAYLVGSKMK